MNGPFAVPLPVVGALLVALPVAYQLNDRVTPWGGGRLAADGDRYRAFWTSVVVLHLASTGAVLVVVVASGTSLSTVGLALPTHDLTALYGAGSAIALAAYLWVVFRSPPLDPGRLRSAGDGWTPATRREQLGAVAWLGVVPGLCEEVVYRGFALSGLLAAGLPPWAAVAGATAPFVLLHGRAATASPRLLARYAGLGVGFALVFLAYGTVWPVAALHAAFNLGMTAQGTNRYQRTRP